jgi:hypothetical protein
VIIKRFTEIRILHGVDDNTVLVYIGDEHDIKTTSVVVDQWIRWLDIFTNAEHNLILQQALEQIEVLHILAKKT